MSFAPRQSYTGLAQKDGSGGIGIGGAVASARWEQEREERRSRAFPSPALVMMPEGGRGEGGKRLVTVEGGAGRDADSRREISTASRVAELSPPPLEHARSVGSNSTASTNSADSLLLAASARRRRPSSSTTVGSKPSLSPSSFRVPSLSIAPSAGSSALFDLVRDRLAQEGSVARLQHFQRAPKPLNPLPPACAGPSPSLFIPNAPISPPQPSPPSPVASFSNRSLRPNPSFSLTKSPNLPPRAQAIFLPPLDQTPTLTPSTTALEIARSPPAPLPPIAELPAVAEPSTSTLVLTRTGTRRRHGKGRLSAAQVEESEAEETAPPSKKRRGTVAEPVATGPESATDALERNRQAARKSRGRKKDHIEGLTVGESPVRLRCAL